MKKVIILLILFALSLGTFSCGGGAGSAEKPDGTNPGNASVVLLLPTPSVAQTNSPILLTAKVFDGNGNGVPNTRVIFTNLSPVGVLSSTVAATDGSGTAMVNLSSTTPGFSTVQAEVNTGVGQVRDQKTMFFSTHSVAQLTPLLTLDVNGDNDDIFNESSDFILFENTNDNTVIVRATVSNAAFLISGSQVTFGADRPYKVGTAPDAKCSDGSDVCDVIFPGGNVKITNNSGQADVTVIVVPSILTSISTTLNITAQADIGAFNMVTLFLEPVTIETVEVFANPQSVASKGTSDISARVTTSAGTPTPDGTTVHFETDKGGIEPFAQTTNGIAKAKYTAPEVTSNTTAKITASVGVVSDFVSVAITAVPPALAVNPASITVSSSPGGTGSYTIVGGVPPYSVFTNRPDVTSFSLTDTNVNTITVTSSGGTFTIVNDVAVTADTTVTITVADAAGSNKTVDFKIDLP